jgi:hypothetical protein
VDLETWAIGAALRGRGAGEEMVWKRRRAGVALDSDGNGLENLGFIGLHLLLIWLLYSLRSTEIWYCYYGYYGLRSSIVTLDLERSIVATMAYRQYSVVGRPIVPPIVGEDTAIEGEIIVRP